MTYHVSGLLGPIQSGRRVQTKPQALTKGNGYEKWLIAFRPVCPGAIAARTMIVVIPQLICCFISTKNRNPARLRRARERGRRGEPAHGPHGHHRPLGQRRRLWGTLSLHQKQKLPDEQNLHVNSTSGARACLRCSGCPVDAFSAGARESRRPWNVGAGQDTRPLRDLPRAPDDMTRRNGHPRADLGPLAAGRHAPGRRERREVAGPAIAAAQVWRHRVTGTSR